MNDKLTRDIDRSIVLIELTSYINDFIDHLRDKGHNVSALKVYGKDLSMYFGWAGEKCVMEDKNLVKLGAVLKFYSSKNLPRREGDLSFITPKTDIIDIDGYRVRSTAPHERFQISTGFYKGNIDAEAIRASYPGKIF